MKRRAKVYGSVHASRLTDLDAPDAHAARVYVDAPDAHAA